MLRRKKLANYKLQTTKFIDMEIHYTISLIILAPWFILGAWEILQAIKGKELRQ